jgi:hypothetical protein
MTAPPSFFDVVFSISQGGKFHAGGRVRCAVCFCALFKINSAVKPSKHRLTAELICCKLRAENKSAVNIKNRAFAAE